MTEIGDEIQAGSLVLANRLVMPPMATGTADSRGRVTKKTIAYYAARAGKIGLITLEHAFVSEEGKAHPGQISIASKEDLEGLRELTLAVHSRGTTKIFAQINHAGSAGGYETGGLSDIRRIENAFAGAALRAKQAGFDGVEIHAAHGYLLNQFYSPLANRRTDSYSAASLENRTRLTAEIIRAVREAVGKDYPVSLRFGACDYQRGGSTLEEAPAAARLYAAAGLDMISVSGGMNGFAIRGVTSPGWFGGASRKIREAVHIPVLLTGGIRTKQEAEEFLNDGSADLVGVGRPMMAEPDDTIRAFLG